jgi:hypothetical protein
MTTVWIMLLNWTALGCGIVLALGSSGRIRFYSAQIPSCWGPEWKGSLCMRTNVRATEEMGYRTNTDPFECHQQLSESLCIVSVSGSLIHRNTDPFIKNAIWDDLSTARNDKNLGSYRFGRAKDGSKWTLTLWIRSNSIVNQDRFVEVIHVASNGASRLNLRATLRKKQTSMIKWYPYDELAGIS